jgi:hypothetical protein
MRVKTNIGRLFWVVFFVIVGGMGLLYLAYYSPHLRFSWIKTGAGVGLVVTTYVGWRAKEKDRVSMALVLLLLGNLVAFTVVLLPTESIKSELYDVAGLIYLLSFVARIVSPWRLLRK